MKPAGMSSDNSLWQRLNVLAVLRQLFGKAEIVHFFFTTYDLRQVSLWKIPCTNNASVVESRQWLPVHMLDSEGFCFQHNLLIVSTSLARIYIED